MSAQVSKGSTKPERVTPSGPRQPSSAKLASVQIWKAWVSTDWTSFTIRCQRGSRATISRQTCGMAPMPTARMTQSKSFRTSSTRVPARRRSQNDSGSHPSASRRPPFASCP